MNSVEQILKDSGCYAAVVHGISMQPLLIDHRDVAYIEPTSTIRRLDVVLFRRKNGQLVLHRVLKCQHSGTHYLVAGDNDTNTECVEREQILGVMTAFCRNGKTTKATAVQHRLYARLWNLTPFTRNVLQRVCRRLQKRRNT